MLGYGQETFDAKTFGTRPEATHSHQAHLLLSKIFDPNYLARHVHLDLSVAEPSPSDPSASKTQVTWKALEQATGWLQVLLNLGVLSRRGIGRRVPGSNETKDSNVAGLDGNVGQCPLRVPPRAAQLMLPVVLRFGGLAAPRRRRRLHVHLL